MYMLILGAGFLMQNKPAHAYGNGNRMSCANGGGVCASLSAQDLDPRDNPPPYTGGWSFCASEGEYCQVPYGGQVLYGAQGQYFSQYVNGGIYCGNIAFGDPIPGVRKACWVQPDSSGGYPPPSPQGNWTYCATENQICQLPHYGNLTVRYGANGRFNYLRAQDQILCSNDVFGDPNFNVRKHCEYSNR